SRSTMKIVGINNAESLNQYCTAWATVTERIPPVITVGKTTKMTIAGPSQAGIPVVADMAMAAPCNWGIIYNQPVKTTMMAVSRRRGRDGNRSDIKSGIV